MTGEEMGIGRGGEQRGMEGSNREEKGMEKKTTSFRRVWNVAIWHGGSVYDAWLNSVAVQVGSLILTLPYTFAQMGYWFGIGSQFLYGAFGCWSVYLITLFHAEASRRTRATGAIHEKHVLQYHEVISIVAGKTLGNLVLAFNMTALGFVCVLQLIACSSHVYYMNSSWNKRQWLYLFGALAIPTVLLPSVHNFRVASFLGIVTTSITSAYMVVAAIQHGQVTPSSFTYSSLQASWSHVPTGHVYQTSEAVHQYVAFLLNANPLFLAWEKVVGVHTSRRFVLRALVRVPVVLVIWFFALAIPFFGPINSIMGAFLVSFSVYIIPGVAFMKAYSKKQLETAEDEIAKCGPLMYWISAIIATWAFVFGFGFGGWASGTNFIRQIQSFGFFDKCYQCPSKH